MKRLTMLAIIGIFAICLNGCGKPAIDSSSEDAMGKSCEKILKSLSDSEKLKFKIALTTIQQERIKEKQKKMKNMNINGLGGAMKAATKMQKEVMDSFNGMTYDDVINEYEKIKDK